MLEQLKKQTCEANKLLVGYNLVDLTFGNVSAIDRASGVVAIKPSGVDYASLKPKDIVLVDMRGKKVEGELNPSSDTPTHACLYRAFRTIGAIVHTHSRCATAFAQAKKPVPCLGTTHADFFYGDVPLTRVMRAHEIKKNYEENTGAVIVERFRDINPLEFPGVLVACHGPFAWADTPKKAVENAYALECISEIALKTFQINPRARAIAGHLLTKHFKRKHGRNAYYGQRKGKR
jgi:L-ribulose-5-phosphate 4-epimerase